MLNQLFENPRYIGYAILVHIAFVVIIVFSLNWQSKPHQTPSQENVVQAVAIDENKVQAELDKLKEAEKRKQQQEEARRKAQEKKAREAKQAREREEKRLTELKKKQAAEQLRLKEQQKKNEEEAKKAKELEQKQQAEAARLEKLKQEKEALEKKRKEEEAKRQAEEKRKQEEEKRRKEEQQLLQEQMAAEQAQLEAQREKKVQSIVDQYIEIIKQKVTRNWFKPAGAEEGLSCTVSVRLIPGGEVLDVKIVTSSGDPVFDRSVETAVLKASPLPLPPDTSLFERFRVLQFVFKPEE